MVRIDKTVSMETNKIIKDKKYKFFVGIDVSKDKLDFAVMKAQELLFHKEIPNNILDIQEFIIQLRSMTGFNQGKAIFCMENTGFYCNHLLTVCLKRRINVVVENATHIKNSMGLVRGKDDKVDAIRIAKFAQKNSLDLRIWVPVRPVMTQLKSLVTLKERLLGLKVALKTPLEEQRAFVTKHMHKASIAICTRSLTALELDLVDIEGKIDLLLNNDERLKRLMEIITSVYSIGPITARQFIICTNEFKDITDAKKFASYAGVAPFKKESGKLTLKPRVSHMANKKMKSLLHMCAMVSLQSNNPIRRYFDRKTKIDGKQGMLVVNAVRNKLILRVFACVRQDRLYQKEYSR